MPQLSANRVAWPMVAGVLLVGLLVAGVGWLLAPSAGVPEEMPLPIVLAILLGMGVAGGLLGALVAAIFAVFAALAGYWASPPRGHQVWLGAGMACVLAALLVASKVWVPSAWNSGVHNVTFALWLNALFFVPALAGRLYGRRFRQTLPELPSFPPPEARPAWQRALRQAVFIQFVWSLAASPMIWRDTRVAGELLATLLLFWGVVYVRHRQLGSLARLTEREIRWLPFAYVWFYLALALLLRLWHG